MAHITEKLGLVIGGTALGIVSMTAYQKLQTKNAPASLPVAIPAPSPVPRPAVAGSTAPTSAIDKLENAKRIIPFGPPGM
jgi:hypothetical protein